MYTKKLVNPLDTPARKAAWETLKKELTGREIGELIGCSPKTVDVWRRKKGTLRIYPHTAEKLIELLDQFSLRHKDEPEPVSEEAVPEVAEKTTATPVRKDHVYMIPQIEKQVVLIDLINQELNDMDADRLVGIYRAIMAKII